MKTEYASNTSIKVNINNFDTALMQKPKVSVWFSAPVIILSWFLAMPLGIFLTYKRARLDKKAAVVIGNTVIVFGVIYGLIALTLKGEESGPLMLGFSIILLSLGFYNRIRGKSFLKYIELVQKERYIVIDDIARKANAEYDTAIKNMEALLEVGYFEGWYINYKGRRLEHPPMEPVRNPVKEEINEGEVELCAVTCKSCGAPKNIPKGAVVKCDYCGSALEANEKVQMSRNKAGRI